MPSDRRAGAGNPSHEAVRAGRLAQNASAGGRYYTRLFCGQRGARFADWLYGLRLGRQYWNLEILSPYFDPTGVPRRFVLGGSGQAVSE